ncbi:hypothetical protein Taro_007551 [Colocasia esculenta]|uniref:Uncharacterized protein n=1 Tax=Colocasia esculenta TaxID=4460 RepID=A0A843U0Q3_COLES|nr:hypothetical protein [Colocasia esculenta]
MQRGNQLRSLPEGPEGKAYPGAHADTQPGHENLRGNTGSVAPPMAVAIPSRRVRGPRQQPCRDGAARRDSTPVATGKQTATAILIAVAKYAAIRSRPTRATPLLMSRRADHRMLHPGPPKTTRKHTHGEGSMGKALRLTTKPRGLPIHPDWEGHKKSLPFTKNEPTRGPSRQLATSSSLHARRSATLHEPPASTTPDRRRRASPPPEEREKGERGKKGKG